MITHENKHEWTGILVPQTPGGENVGFPPLSTQHQGCGAVRHAHLWLAQKAAWPSTGDGAPIGTEHCLTAVGFCNLDNAKLLADPQQRVALWGKSPPRDGKGAARVGGEERSTTVTMDTQRV